MCRSLPISSVLVNSVSPYSLSVEHALRYICNQMTSYQFFLHHKICLSIRWIMKSLWYFQIKIGGFIIQLFALLSPRAYIIHINKVFFFISCRMDNVIFLWRPIVKTQKTRCLLNKKYKSEHHIQSKSDRTWNNKFSCELWLWGV